ncbi:hypothetical protein CYMTET_9042 [Cymbomonas tetramitiformis]|uniref:Uncharacterized protein n=1 Tax=Cymbomonas tetramitiformis TaxID=36881 RepID=A0AAE0GS50_9CHLO|nr:hypothetical protein CYMTET_9042 [Cymbomonas tetramitiformis]
MGGSSRLVVWQSEVSADDPPRPVDSLHEHAPDLCFADRIGHDWAGSLRTDEGRALALNYMHAGTDDGSDNDDVDCSTDEDASVDGEASPAVSPCVTTALRTQGWGKPPLGLGRSSAIALLACAFFCVCATAAPQRGVRWCWHRRAHGSTGRSFGGC